MANIVEQCCCCAGMVQEFLAALGNTLRQEFMMRSFRVGFRCLCLPGEPSLWLAVWSNSFMQG